MIDRRAKFRQGLNSLYLSYYDGICSLLSVNDWNPYFGLRTFAEQQALYAQGRTAPGAIVTNAPAGSSAHEYGCATDWARFVNGNLIWLAANHPDWEEYFNACQKVGVTLGKNFSHPDTDHNELQIADPWSSVMKAPHSQVFIQDSHMRSFK